VRLTPQKDWIECSCLRDGVPVVLSIRGGNVNSGNREEGGRRQARGMKWPNLELQNGTRGGITGKREAKPMVTHEMIKEG